MYDSVFLNAQFFSFYSIDTLNTVCTNFWISVLCKSTFLVISFHKFTPEYTEKFQTAAIYSHFFPHNAISRLTRRKTAGKIKVFTVKVIIDFFIHQLMQKWAVLKNFKLTLKLTLKQLRHVSVQSRHHQGAYYSFLPKLQLLK
jgi:hypothetical protein